jgi:Uma2 family endonuclease
MECILREKIKVPQRKIMLAQKKLTITPEQYLIQEREAEFKSEYVDGEIFAMSGASRKHNEISSNIVINLGTQLFEKECSVYSSDMKVKASKVDAYTYPDIVVSCDSQEFEDENTDVLLNPIVIIEILSDSTEAYDRGLKFSNYQLIDSLCEYLLVSQKNCSIEKFEKQKGNLWTYSKFASMDDIVAIKSIECELCVKDVYRRVNFNR